METSTRRRERPPPGGAGAYEDHPIRTIEMLADTELRRLSPVFDQMYSRMGRPSIPPEHLQKPTSASPC